MLMSNDVQVMVVGTELKMNDEPTIKKSNTKFQIEDYKKRHLKMSDDIVVIESIVEPDDGVIVDNDEYVIDYNTGTIVFKEYKKRSRVYVSAEYFPTQAFASAKGLTLNKDREVRKESFLSGFEALYVRGEKEITGSIEEMILTDTYYEEYITNDEPILLRIKLGDIEENIFALFNSETLTIEEDDVIRNIEFYGIKMED